MFSSLFLAALLAPLALVSADPNPTAPGPGDSFNQGTPCTISWDADTSGVWKTMNIELMSGDNIAMSYLTTVATVDGTDASNTTFSYPCPAVNPNSAIYFYQFTSPFSKSIYWTTRFAIADATGKTTPPANANQPNGDAIPWGVGVLADPSQANPSPAFGQSAAPSATGSSAPSGSAPAGSSPAGSSPAASSPASSPAPGSSQNTNPPVSSSPSSSHAGAATTTNGTLPGAAAANTTTASGSKNSDTANAALAGMAVDARLFRAAVALGVAAVTFAVVL